MRSESSAALQAPRRALWPPDDTEESVLGTNLHQETIANLRLGLNELASALVPAGGERPWYAYGQTTITGWQRRDGSPYTTLPDIYVYRQARDRRRSSLSVEQDGPPLLIVEVLSPKTQKADLDEAAGKPFSYALAGVQEYLILDPLGVYEPAQGRGWRLERGSFVPWRPEAPRRWRSTQLPLAIGLEGIEVAVYGPDGRRQWREGEFAPELARREAELARREAEIIALRRRLGRQAEE